MGFSFTITLKQKPKEITHMLSLCLVTQRGMRVTSLGFWLMVILNEKTLNLEKATSNVHSVFLLFYVVNIHRWLFFLLNIDFKLTKTEFYFGIIINIYFRMFCNILKYKTFYLKKLSIFNANIVFAVAKYK